MTINIDYLGVNEAHIWQIPAGALAVRQPQLEASLSADELARAERYVRPADRERFIRTRGMLRALLGKYLDIPPAEVGFEYGEHGKPSIKAGLASDGLTFNVSHAGEWAAYIFSRHRRVGIDIERVRSEVDIEGIARRFFSPLEQRALENRVLAERRIAFFNTWARKEAFIKALGSGLFHELKQFDVSVAPDESAALLAIEGDPKKAHAWSLSAFSPGEGYAGAWVTEGNVVHKYYDVAESE